MSWSHALVEVSSFKCLHTGPTQGTENQHSHCLPTCSWLSQMLRKLTTTEQINLDPCSQKNVNQESPGVCRKHKHKRETRKWTKDLTSKKTESMQQTEDNFFKKLKHYLQKDSRHSHIHKKKNGLLEHKPNQETIQNSEKWKSDYRNRNNKLIRSTDWRMVRPGSIPTTLPSVVSPGEQGWEGSGENEREWEGALLFFILIYFCLFYRE